MKKDVNHVTAVQMGGRKRLPVVDSGLSDELRRTLELRTPIPKTRADCPQVRPCPYFCEHNAWVVSGLDQPGRRRVGGTLPPTKVSPTVDQNCVADHADIAHEQREAPDVATVASVLGVCARQVRRYAASAMTKLPAPLQKALDDKDQRVHAIAVLRELME